MSARRQSPFRRAARFAAALGILAVATSGALPGTAAIAATSTDQPPVLGLTNSDNESGNFVAGNHAKLLLTPWVDSSGGPEAETLTVTDTLPSGLTPGTAAASTEWACSTLGQAVSCTWTPPSAVNPGTTLAVITIPVTASSSASGTLSNEARIESVDGVADDAIATETVTTFTVVRSADTVAYGETETINVTGLPSNATGTVMVASLNPTGSGVITLCSISLPGTSCTTSPTLFPLLPYSLEARWSGDSAYAVQYATGRGFTVTQLTAAVSASASPTSQTFGSAVTLAAASAPSNRWGYLTFKSGGTTLCTATTPTTSCSTSATLPAGSYPVTLNWNGGMEYSLATATTSFQIVKATPPLSATAAPVVASFGTPVTLSVSGLPAQATGTVSFTANGVDLCSAAVAATTWCQTSNTLASADYQVVASYSGDQNVTMQRASTMFSVAPAVAGGESRVAPAAGGDDTVPPAVDDAAPLANDLATKGVAGRPQWVALPVRTGDSVALVDASGDRVGTVTVTGEGRYVLDSSTATITFTPVNGFAGVARGVRYELTGGGGLSATGTYRPVATLPPRPVAIRLTSTGRAGKTQVATVRLRVSDRVTLLGHNAVAVKLLTVRGEGTYRISTSGRLSFTPVNGFAGKARPVTFQVTDTYGQWAKASYTAKVVQAKV